MKPEKVTNDVDICRPLQKGFVRIRSRQEFRTPTYVQLLIRRACPHFLGIRLMGKKLQITLEEEATQEYLKWASAKLTAEVDEDCEPLRTPWKTPTN